MQNLVTAFSIFVVVLLSFKVKIPVCMYAVPSDIESCDFLFCLTFGIVNNVDGYFSV